MSEEDIISTEAAIDRISSLPEDILCHILSFLPTKQAFTTTILSKRWTHLWRFVSVLDFSNTKLKNQADYYRFNKFVNTILHLRDTCGGSHSIDTFFLDIQYNYCDINYYIIIDHSLTNINNWVKYAVEHKVQYLNLSLHPLVAWQITPPKLPTSILSCTNLVVLKLRWFDVDVEVYHFSFRFPSLKTLCLEQIYFEHEQDFMLLLDGCPILEQLQVYDIFFKDVTDLFDDSQHLEISSLRKLIKADITACYCHFPMKALSNLEFLRIQRCKDYHPDDFPPTFHKLTHLVLNYDYDCDIVVQVLQHCPNLQSLELYQKLPCDWEDDLVDEFITEDGQENCADPEIVPCCLSLNLTTCTIWDFAYGDLHRHIMLARFILRNARVLKTMTIWCNWGRSQIERQLSSCPRASATCQLSIY